MIIWKIYNILSVSLKTHLLLVSLKPSSPCLQQVFSLPSFLMPWSPRAQPFSFLEHWSPAFFFSFFLSLFIYLFVCWSHKPFGTMTFSINFPRYFCTIICLLYLYRELKNSEMMYLTTCMILQSGDHDYERRGKLALNLQGFKHSLLYIVPPYICAKFFFFFFDFFLILATKLLHLVASFYHRKFQKAL